MQSLSLLSAGTLALWLCATPLAAQQPPLRIKFPTTKSSKATSQPSTSPLWQLNIKGIGG